MGSLMRNILQNRFLSSRFTQCIHKSCPVLGQIAPSNAIHTTPALLEFWEKEKKSGYRKELPLPSKKQLILDGMKELRQEIMLWKDEMKEKLESDPLLVFRPGETDVVFQFKSEEDLNKWVVTSDSDHSEGKSTAKFEISDAEAGLFHGYVSGDVLKDGKIKRTGFANIRSKRVRKSFKREATYDWTQYNTLVLKVRGDGRSYLINLHTEGYHDLLWNDVYHFALYTRGGPHWQSVKIPFSKFFFASKGRVQDQQAAIHLNRVTHLGFSVGSRAGLDGPFSLEIAYVGLEFDPGHTEEFAYEMYKTDKYITAT